MTKMIQIIIAAIAIVVFPCVALAQTAALLPNATQQFFDNNGNPLSAGTVTTYIVGTTTLKTTWRDAAELVPNTNPIVLDAGGKAIIYGDGNYRQVVRDRLGNLIWDAVTSAFGVGGATLLGDGTAVGTILPWSGLVAPTHYAFAYGQELSRTTYSALYSAITLSPTINCTSASAVLSSLADTTQIPIGAAVEATCVPSGVTVLSKTASTITVSSNATVTTAVAAKVFPYGNGNGTTTFNVPDMRGRTLAGRDDMGGTAASRLTATFFATSGTGATGGAQSKILATTNLPAYTPTGTIAITDPGHTHTVPMSSQASMTAGATNVIVGAASTPTSSSTTGVTAAFTGTAQGGAATAFALVQPTITLNYIIKILPDTTISTLNVVTTLGGQVGDISCGSGLVCAGNSISSTGSGTIVIYIPAVCDGVTDDTAAFVNSINLAPSTGAIWQVPGGVCLVTTFTIDKPGIFRGTGMGSTGIPHAGSTVLRGTVANSNVITINAINTVTLQDFTVDSSIAAASRTGAGIKILSGNTSLIRRVTSYGHQYGFWNTIPGTSYEQTFAGGNASHGYFFDGTVFPQNEIGLHSPQSIGNGGSGFYFAGPGIGIFSFRPVAVANVVDGITIDGTAGTINDFYLSLPELSGNGVDGLNIANNATGLGFQVNGGLVENSAFGAGGGNIAIGTGNHGVQINGVSLLGGASPGFGISDKGIDTVLSNNYFTRMAPAIARDNAAVRGSYTGNVVGVAGAATTVGLLIGGAATAFTGTGNDWSAATTPRSGALPSGSCYWNNKGDNTNSPCGLTLAAGGILYSTASALAVSVAGSSGQLFQSAGAGVPGWTAAAFPATSGTAGNVLRSNGTNFLSTTLAASDLSGLGAGVATWLATPTSANLGTAVFDKTGSGSLVFANTPTFITPNLGVATFTGLQNGTGVASGNNLIAINIASATARFQIWENSIGQAIYGVDAGGAAYAWLETCTGVCGTYFGTKVNAPTDMYTNNVRRIRIAGNATHFLSGGTAPALTSCGTSPSIIGTDADGTVTMGTGTPSGCVITFNVAYTAAPSCMVTWRATPLASQSYTISTTALTLTQTPTSSNVIDYICRGG